MSSHADVPLKVGGTQPFRRGGGALAGTSDDYLANECIFDLKK